MPERAVPTQAKRNYISPEKLGLLGLSRATGTPLEHGRTSKSLRQTTFVLLPPHLAEQWQAELIDKFHLDAELVLPSTAGRL